MKAIVILIIQEPNGNFGNPEIDKDHKRMFPNCGTQITEAQVW